ncbi:MAG TPA: hypothetical protein VER17_17900 [Tepidisphaeraceae bacterium]|nr:hypothetical protein [Tepidisphaeraceae bacterium]
MSTHNDGSSQTQDQGAGDGDLTAALAAGTDAEFVATEEKKPVVTPGMLYLLLLVAVGGGGTYYMYHRQGPASAQAATAESQKAKQTIDTFLASGPGGMKMMESMLKDTEKVVQQFNDYPSVTQVPLSALQTNPFKFAKVEAAPTAAAVKVDEDLAKKKRDEERQAGLKASQALNLQSIIHSGSRKACMINNTLVLEGQQVEQFTVEKITPSSVILRTGAFRYERRMQQPH